MRAEPSRKPETYLRDELVSQLKEAGLSSYEATTYSSLLSRWPASASDLCKDTGIPDTKIYHVLDSLQGKGIIGVREGRPSLFRPLPPKEALGNLKNAIRTEYETRAKKLDLLASKVEPLFEKTIGREDLELAYIIKGSTNILNRMKALMESAKREIVLYIPDPDIFDKLRDGVQGARRRGVRIQLAVAKSLSETVSPSDFSGRKLLTKDCEKSWAIIKDDEILLNVSGWQGQNPNGILTQDSSLIAMSKSWLTNPRCCY